MTNRYSFVMNDVPIILKPLTPKEVYKYQKVLRQRVEEFEKEKENNQKESCDKSNERSKQREEKGELEGMRNEKKKSDSHIKGELS